MTLATRLQSLNWRSVLAVAVLLAIVGAASYNLGESAAESRAFDERLGVALTHGAEMAEIDRRAAIAQEALDEILITDPHSELFRSDLTVEEVQDALYRRLWSLRDRLYDVTAP